LKIDVFSQFKTLKR